MTSARPRQSAPSRRRSRVAVSAALTALTVLAGGCGGAAAPVRLPVKPPAATQAATSAAVTPSPRQQVVAALAGYTAALGAAGKSRDAVVARRLLQPYLAANRIDGVVQTMSGIWAKGEVFFGRDILHVLGVTVSGQSAFVHDCDDTSGMGLAYQATGAVVPGSSGTPELNIVTHLALADGRWLVEFQLIEDVPCTP